jgi:ketosteroid isomerase-like protein
MSEENVELIRDFYESLNSWLASYWSDPVAPIEQSPELEEMFGHLDPEAEWDWLFSPETFRGRKQLLQAAADYLETVGDWQVEIEELTDGTEDRVLVVARVVARGRGSGVPVLQRVFSAVTVRNGKVARIEDHSERAQALEAAGLRE